MKCDFLEADGGEVIPEPDPEEEEGEGDQNEKVTVTLTLGKDEARLLIRIADNLGWQLSQLVGG